MPSAPLDPTRQRGFLLENPSIADVRSKIMELWRSITKGARKYLQRLPPLPWEQILPSRRHGRLVYQSDVVNYTYTLFVEWVRLRRPGTAIRDLRVSIVVRRTKCHSLSYSMSQEDARVMGNLSVYTEYQKRIEEGIKKIAARRLQALGYTPGAEEFETWIPWRQDPIGTTYCIGFGCVSRIRQIQRQVNHLVVIPGDDQQPAIALLAMSSYNDSRCVPFIRKTLSLDAIEQRLPMVRRQRAYQLQTRPIHIDADESVGRVSRSH